MKIIVETNKYPQVKVELDVYSLTYDLKKNMFFMHGAPPAVIYADKQYLPYSIHFQADKAFIYFDGKSEAEDFIRWVKVADRDVNIMFSQMTD